MYCAQFDLPINYLQNLVVHHEISLMIPAAALPFSLFLAGCISITSALNKHALQTLWFKMPSSVHRNWCR